MPNDKITQEYFYSGVVIMFGGLSDAIADAGWFIFQILFVASLIALCVYIPVLIKIKQILQNQNIYFSYEKHYFWILLMISSCVAYLLFLVFFIARFDFSISRLDIVAKFILTFLVCLPNVLFFNSIRKKRNKSALIESNNGKNKFLVKIFALTILSSFIQLPICVFICSIILVLVL